MRGIKIIFVAILAGLILLPPFEMAFPFVEVPELDERRILAPPPDLAKTLLHGDGRLAAAINRWFDDRIGFRPWLIRLSNQIEYSLFDYSSKVYIGSNNEFFDRDNIRLEVTNERDGAALEREVEGRFNAVEAYLAQRGVLLVIVSNPIKSDLLPQLLPADAPHFPPVTTFNRIEAFLKNNQNWLYLDGRDLLKNCTIKPLFFQLDEHPTMSTGYCLAVQIANGIAAKMGRPQPYWTPKFTYHSTTYNLGGLVSYLSIFSGLTEHFTDPDQAYEPSKPVPDGAFNRDPAHFYDRAYVIDPQHPFEWIYTSGEKERDKKLPPMMLYGNSFTDSYLPVGFQFQFAEVYRVRSTNYSLTTALAKMPPTVKIFIWQFLEPYLTELVATSQTPTK